MLLPAWSDVKVMPGAMARAESGAAAFHTVAESGGTVTVTALSDPERTAARRAGHTPSKRMPAEYVGTATSRESVELLRATMYSTFWFRSIRLTAKTPAWFSEYRGI